MSSSKKIIYNKMMDTIIEKFEDKVYWGICRDSTDPQDLNLILARKYCFWLFHENYPEYALIKRRIQLNKNAVKVIIDNKPEKDIKMINEHIKLYQWKEENYGSSGDK